MTNKILENMKQNIDISEFINIAIVAGMLGLIFMFLSPTIIVALFIAIVAVGLDYNFFENKRNKRNVDISEFINIATVSGMLGLIFMFLSPTIIVAFCIAIVAVGLDYNLFEKKNQNK